MPDLYLVAPIVEPPLRVSSAMAASSSSSATAKANFELNNDMIQLDPAKDSVFHFDAQQQKEVVNSAPWKKE